MSYDSEQDVLVEEITEFPADKEGQTIKVGMYSYKGSEQKVGINRCWKKRDGTTSIGKMGRLSPKEAKRLGVRLVKYFKGLKTT